MNNQPVTQGQWNNTDAPHEVQRQNPHERLGLFSEAWGKHMSDWANHQEWAQKLDEKMARVLNGLLPATESADDIVLEIVALEEQQSTFSTAIYGAETNALNHAGEMRDCKERRAAADARLMFACAESNAGKRKAELTLAQAKDDDWQVAHKAFRKAEHDKLVAEAHQKQLERDRSRIAGQVWGRRVRLELLAARLNAVTMKKGEPTT